MPIHPYPMLTLISKATTKTRGEMHRLPTTVGRCYDRQSLACASNGGDRGTALQVPVKKALVSCLRLLCSLFSVLCSRIDHMQLRTLGATGLLVSPIGLGLAALGRPGYINLGHAADLGHDYDVAAMTAHTHA